MKDIKQSNKLLIFFKSGRDLEIKKTLTDNYIQLINWLISNDDIPFKIKGNDDTTKDFILYKDSIESIEILK